MDTASVIAPEIMRALPHDFCRCWIVQANRGCHSEGDVLSLIKFLGAELNGVLTTHKIRSEPTSRHDYNHTAATIYAQSKTTVPTRRAGKEPGPFFELYESHGHWAQDCERVVKESTS